MLQVMIDYLIRRKEREFGKAKKTAAAEDTLVSDGQLFQSLGSKINYKKA